MKHVLLMVAMLVACGGDSSGDSAVQLTGPDAFAGAPLAELSSGDCPPLANPGERTFTSYGMEREVIFRFPKNPAPGLPVVFFWHGMGDSAAGFDMGLDLEQWAEDNNAVAVIPQSTDPMLITWDLFDEGKDAALFDDLRTCLSNELQVDLSRISTTGFSFGAMYATWLTMHRGDTLSASMIMSGGTDSSIGFGYTKPASDLPVLVMWGGSADVFDAGIVAMDFQGAAQDLAGNLKSDGHTVVECDHGLGHSLPSSYEDAMTPWLLEHRYGEASPFQSGIDGFPDFCELAR